MRRSESYFLQHKLPWETTWEDVEAAGDPKDEKFIKTLKNEPSHIIEMEYRVVKKENFKLKTTNRSVINPVHVLSGTQLATVVEQKLESIQYVKKSCQNRR